MLEALKFSGINHPGYFVGGEHPIHQCFEEFSSDVSSDLPPDVISSSSSEAPISNPGEPAEPFSSHNR
jgi:hypothetical protein